MSGGSFDYAYIRLENFADDLNQMIARSIREFSEETIVEFRNIEGAARFLALHMKEVEWLCSYDTDENTFLDRVAKIKQDAREANNHAKAD